MEPRADHFRTFAAYNAWANRRLYDTAAAIPDAAFRADRGAFFGSVCGTLNHILVADRIWLHRLTGTGPLPARLDETVHADLPSLRQARTAEDARLITFVSSIDDTGWDRCISYTTMSGDHHQQPLAQLLAHLFNHQTHHRGQAHTLLTQLGYAAPPLDLLIYLREPTMRGQPPGG